MYRARLQFRKKDVASTTNHPDDFNKLILGPYRTFAVCERETEFLVESMEQVSGYSYEQYIFETWFLYEPVELVKA